MRVQRDLLAFGPAHGTIWAAFLPKKGICLSNSVTLNSEWCKGCHICVQVCPHGVLEVDEANFVRGFHPVRVTRPEDCTACLQCELLCPDLAIMVTSDSEDQAGELAPAGAAGQ